MLTWIGNVAIRRPKSVLAATLVIAILAIVFGASAPQHLRAGGFFPDDVESARANDILTNDMHAGSPNLVFTVTAPEGLETGAARAAADKVVADLQGDPLVSNIVTYWTAPPQVAPTLRSQDGKTALITARIAGDDTDAPKHAAEVAAGKSFTENNVTVTAGGEALAFKQINDRITRDLTLAEAVAIPITAILLMLVFGSLISSLLPLLVGLISIIGTLGILRMFTLVTDVSIYSLNMTTAMGLALAIDYSLFVVSRYREELAHGRSQADAVRRTVETAGRSVLYSAVTVALALAALAVFPQFFLRSFAYAGVAVVAFAALASILVLPATLMLLGDRVNALDVRKPLRRLFGRSNESAAVPLERTRWYRIASFSMRHAVPVTVVVVALLLLLGSPFLSARFGYPDDRVQNDTSASSRQVGDHIRASFAQNANDVVTAVLPGFRGEERQLAEYAAKLSEAADVSGVASAAGVFVDGRQVAVGPPGMSSDAGTYIAIGTAQDPYSKSGSAQLEALESVPRPGEVLFTGPAAQNRDVLHSLAQPLPLALALIVLATFVVLFLFTGSLVLPVKALILNTLSLTAAFGAMVWVFQEGHLSGLFGFTPTGYLVANMPILMFCVAFGLSMDYEVFLLSRIREEWVKSGRTSADNVRAVALGIARTGPIITAIAALMAVVFFAMVTGKIAFMQLFALGLTLMVIVDATVVRGILVPALMKMLGTANWWAPKPLVRLHDRFGLEEHDELPDEPKVAQAAP